MKQSNKPPSEVRLAVSKAELIRVLTRMEALLGFARGERLSLFCQDDKLVFRQGYVEDGISCEGHFDGQFSISRAACRKWLRCLGVGGRARAFMVEETLPASSITSSLHFVDGKLQFGSESLSLKWEPRTAEMSFQQPKVVSPQAAGVNAAAESNGGMPSPRIFPGAGGLAEKMCLDFRVNVNIEQLLYGLRRCHESRPETHLLLRTWNGELILNRGTFEFRLDCTGFIRDRALIAAADVERLAQLKPGIHRFETLVSERGILRLLGEQFQLLNR